MRISVKPVLKKSTVQGLLALVLLIMLGTGIGIIPWPVSSYRAEQAVRDQIAASVGEASVSIGTIRLSLLPYPKLIISDFKLQKSEKFSVVSPQAQVWLNPVSLLGGAFKPVMFSLVDPAIELPMERIPTTPSQTAKLAVELIKTYSPQPAKAAIADAFQIRIVNGAIKGTNQTPGSGVTALFGDLSGFSDGSLSFSGRMIWRAQPISVAFSSDAPIKQDGNGRPILVDISSDLGRIKLSGELNTGMFPQFDGSFDSSVTNVGKLSNALGFKPPIASTLNLAITGTSRISSEGIVVSNARVSLGDVKFSGGLNIKSIETRPQISATLATEEINATELLQPYWPKAEGGLGWKRDKLDTSSLPPVDLDLRISAERADLGVARVNDVAISLLASEGKLDATLATAKVFNGSIKGRVTVTNAKSGLALKLHGSFDRLDSGAALLSLMNNRYLEGVASGSITLESEGASSETMMQNLSGNGEFNVENGTVSGINIPGILKKAETRPLSLTGNLRGGTTEFDQIFLKVAIEKGEAKIAEAGMNSPDAAIKMTGSIDIGNRRMAVDGVASGPAMQAKGSTLQLPFSISGTFDDPVLKPDIEKMLRGTATE